MEEEKKSNGKLKGLIILIVGLLLLGVGAYFLLTKDGKETKEDARPSLKDDFYGYVNYETLKNAKIPSDSDEWSHFYDVGKTIENRVKELTNEILTDPNYKNEDIDNLLELVHDYEGRNKRGYDELKPYFDMVDNAKTIEDFNNLQLKFDEELGVNLLMVGAAISDFDDATKNVFVFDQIDNFETYTNDKYARSRELEKKAMYKVMSILGYDTTKSDEIYNKYVEFAKKIQAKSVNKSEINDITKEWNKYTLEEITKEVKNLPIKRFLDNRGIGNEEYYVVTDLGHYKAVDEFYVEENLPFLKDVMKMQIVASYLGYTTEENEKFILDLTNEQNGTKMTIEEMREKSELSLKTSFIMDEVEKRYEKKYFTDEDKKIVADLVEDVKAAYKEEINNSTWLSAETKAKALNKLDTMKVNIGYQEGKEDNDYYKPISKANGGTLIKYIIENNKYNFKEFSKEFHKEAELDSLSTLDVNAFYHPQNNSINFLAGFKGLYENETDYYKKLGYFGYVIAHEISHAFDNAGSKFDATGKLSDWWTTEDRANYEKLSKKIEDFYSKYEVEGFKVDGHKTLGENIADLAAMKTIIAIMEKKGATKEDYQHFFEAYADLWAEKLTKEATENQILEDTHSPGKVRVNAVMSSTDKFYEVYDIKEGDKMYVPKEERVGLW